MSKAKQMQGKSVKTGDMLQGRPLCAPRVVLIPTESTEHTRTRSLHPDEHDLFSAASTEHQDQVSVKSTSGHQQYCQYPHHRPPFSRMSPELRSCTYYYYISHFYHVSRRLVPSHSRLPTTTLFTPSMAIDSGGLITQD